MLQQKHLHVLNKQILQVLIPSPFLVVNQSKMLHDIFQHNGNPLPSPNTCCTDCVFLPPPFQLVYEMPRYPCSWGTKRMTEGDSTAIYIGDVHIQTKFLGYC